LLINFLKKPPQIHLNNSTKRAFRFNVLKKERKNNFIKDKFNHCCPIKKKPN